MFSATVAGSLWVASGWPSTLIRFLVAVFGGFPGNLDLPMFTVLNGGPQPRSEIPLPFYSRFVPTAERRTDSLAYTIHRCTLSDIHTYGLCRVGSRAAGCSVDVGCTRLRSAAAAKYARTCQTESLGYQGGLRCYTLCAPLRPSPRLRLRLFA